MRIALVGPTYPYKGGVATHTTVTAHQLVRAGHDVELVSWSRLYPQSLYPGEQAVPDGGEDSPRFGPAVRPLRWDRPLSWWRTGAALRDRDLVVIVMVVPAQVPALLTLIRALRGGRAGGAGRPAGLGGFGAGRRRPTVAPRVVVLAHNVVPHETHPGDEWLITRLLAAADAVLVHSDTMADEARAHRARRVLRAELPPHPPGGAPSPQGAAAARTEREERGRSGRPVRVLALGMVREYKGVDLLLEAAAQVPGVAVTVAGEQWGRAGARVRELAAGPDLRDRVRLRAGYVPGVEIAALLAGHDVLALPYRRATASQNVMLGHLHGLPVIATRTGTFPDQVRDGVDGLLVPPGDRSALVTALRTVTDPEQLAGLRAGVPAVDLDRPWQRYVEALVTPIPVDGAEPAAASGRVAE